jgi:thiamine biosynthesis lipoprotein
MAERTERFRCFGGTVTVAASGPADVVATALGVARHVALDVHRRLTRFEPTSELSRLNADPRPSIATGALLRRFAAAVQRAGAASGGLVDATCSPPGPPPGWPGHREAVPAGGWRHVHVAGDCVLRPPGVQLDSGGLAKGLAADLMARALAPCESWLVDCGGDLRIGGTGRRPRDVDVADPTTPGGVLHRFSTVAGAVATSGTTRRAWAGGHHLTDPRTGRPAATGLMQVTALAATGLEAEVRAKAALLAGPRDAVAHLPAGGVLVTDDGAVRVVAEGSA